MDADEDEHGHMWRAFTFRCDSVRFTIKSGDKCESKPSNTPGQDRVSKWSPQNYVGTLGNVNWGVNYQVCMLFRCPWAVMLMQSELTYKSINLTFIYLSIVQQYLQQKK